MMTHHNLNNLYKSSSHVNLPQQQKQEELVCVGESAPPLCKVVLASMRESHPSSCLSFPSVARWKDGGGESAALNAGLKKF